VFGKENLTPKQDSLIEPRPLQTVAVVQVWAPEDTEERVTEKPHDKSYFMWINQENTSTREAIAALYRYQYRQSFVYLIPSE